MESQKDIIVNQDFLNQIPLIILFFFSIYLMIFISAEYPQTIQWIDLSLFVLPIPLFGLFPFILGAVLIHALFDKRIVLTSEYLNFIEGRMSWREKSIRVGYDHIREIEIDQTIFQRLIGVGDLGITAIATTLEPTIIMPGIRNPRHIKDIIREKMHLLEAKNGKSQSAY